MLHRKHSTTYAEGCNQGHRKIYFGDITNQPHLIDKSVVEKKGIELCFSGETASDDSLKIATTTSTALSIDSFEEMMIEPNSFSTADVLSTIQKMDTDSISTADFDYYGKREQRELSVSEVASERLYSQAAERRTRMARLAGNHPTDPIRMRNGTVSTVSNTGSGTPSISEIAGYRLHLKAMERNTRLALLKEKYRKHEPKPYLEAVKRPLLLQSNVDSSEIAGCRLHLKAMERRKRLFALQMEKDHKHEPKLILEATPRKSSRCDSCSVVFHRLYNVSKPMQEDGCARRKNIIEASAKLDEVWTFPTEKINIADSHRLYHMGMRQLIALEQRRIEASK